MKDKVVVITGSTSGIGKACAFAFGEAGAKVVISGRDAVKLKSTADELTQKGIICRAVQSDVSQEADAQNLISETIQQFGKLDILINNAGISMRALFQNLDLAVIKQVMDINFYGTVYATKYALPYILESKGSVIGISSIAGYRGLPGRTGYSASKFAMQGFLEALRTEVMHQGVHVMVACPGFTASNIRNTALNAQGNVQGESPRAEEKMMTAEEVATRILKATQKRQREVIMTTQGKLTVFLNKWLPGLTDKLVYNVMAKEKDSPFK
ncbi:SDR family oxidoreductase [Adhaeribacter radiodurans]|uniref:SDR family oxidoreductase n=1 Tax=Adhaeribacter radiodurans TaxID=2745197 RepID=A0A7L7L9H0_9BACT|nr:SDR family oxidoreductase [Adhaeribacter radiodurans]QMU29175.1 SDR family oxidoreductase [Adhaeribacter radiodurans]